MSVQHVRRKIICTNIDFYCFSTRLENISLIEVRRIKMWKFRKNAKGKVVKN